MGAYLILGAELTRTKLAAEYMSNVHTRRVIAVSQLKVVLEPCRKVNTNKKMEKTARCQLQSLRPSLPGNSDCSS